MRKFIILSFLFALFSLHNAYGYDFKEKRLYFSPEKEKQIIDIAKQVCAEVAPDFKIGDLTPLIFNFLKEERYSPFGNREIVSVKFMKDTTDYSEYKMMNPKTKEMIVRKVANARIHVEVLTDKMEPAGIGVYYGVMFSPDYKKYREKNPDFKFEKDKYTELVEKYGGINDIPKKELEKLGIINIYEE